MCFGSNGSKVRLSVSLNMHDLDLMSQVVTIDEKFNELDADTTLTSYAFLSTKVKFSWVWHKHVSLLPIFLRTIQKGLCLKKVVYDI